MMYLNRKLFELHKAENDRCGYQMMSIMLSLLLLVDFYSTIFVPFHH